MGGVTDFHLTGPGKGGGSEKAYLNTIKTFMSNFFCKLCYFYGSVFCFEVLHFDSRKCQ